MSQNGRKKYNAALPGFSSWQLREPVMAAVPVQSLRVSDIKDPMVLFERYSTDEIRTVERKVRGEIEQKKEELRQMVGERYRDLIEAADTIGEMRECSEKVVQSIQDMQNYCHTLKHSRHTPQSSRAEVGSLQCPHSSLQHVFMSPSGSQDSD